MALSLDGHTGRSVFRERCGMGNRDLPVADVPKAECACKHCVARKDMPYPGEDFPGFLPVIFAAFCALIGLTFKTYGSFMGQRFSLDSFMPLFASIFFMVLSGIVFFYAARHFVKRRVIGEDYFLFVDDKNQYHCHRLYPTEPFVVGNQARCLGGEGYVARVRNGGWFRFPLLFRGTTMIRVDTIWRLASWSLARDLRIIYIDGSVLYDDRDTELPGEFLFKTMMEFAARNPISIIKDFRREKQLRMAAEESVRRLGNELTEAHAKLRGQNELLCEFVLFLNGERHRIKEDPGKLGKSPHAQQFRRNIENFILSCTPEQLALSHTLRDMKRVIQEEQSRSQGKASVPSAT